MSEDEEGRRADDPEDGAQWGREPEQRDADHEETGVEGFLGHDVLAELQWLWGCGVPSFKGRSSAGLVSFWVRCREKGRTEFVYCGETADEEAHCEKEGGVCDSVRARVSVGGWWRAEERGTYSAYTPSARTIRP